LQKIGDLIADHALSFLDGNFGIFWNSPPPEGWIVGDLSAAKNRFAATLATAIYVPHLQTKKISSAANPSVSFFTAAVVQFCWHSLMMSLTSMTLVRIIMPDKFRFYWLLFCAGD